MEASLKRRVCPLVIFAEATKPGGNGQHWKTFLKKNTVQDNITEVVLKLYNTLNERDSDKEKVIMREVGVCMCVSICRCMTAYQKSSYGFINPTIVLLS